MSLPKSLYYAVMLLSLFLLLLRWRKLDSRLHVYALVLAAAFISEKINDLFYPSVAGKYATHAYQLIELTAISFYYYMVLRSLRNKKIVLAGIAVYLLFISYYYIYHSENLVTNKTSDLAVGGLIITVHSILYLIELYQQDAPVILKNHPHFWVAAANLMFYSITLVFYVFQFYLLRNSLYYKQLSIIPMFFNLVLYSFYSIAFVCQIQLSMKRSA